MRRAFIYIFSGLLNLIAPIAIFLVSLAIILATPDFLKKSLAQSDLYSAAAAKLDLELSKQVKGAPLAIKKLKEILTQEIDAQYLQKAAEGFLDQLYLYSQNKSDKLPSVSVSDLQKKLGRRNEAFRGLTLKDLIGIQGDLNLDPKIAEKIRFWYSIGITSATLGVLASLFLILCLFSTGATLTEKIQLTAKSLLKIGLPSLILTAIGLGISYKTQLPLPELPAGLDFLKGPVLTFSNLLTRQLLVYLLIGYGGVSAAGLILYLFNKSFFRKI